MKKVEAIVRAVSFEGIVKALEGIGIKGMTIMEVKGIGEQVELFRPYTIHKRIELFVPDERAEEVSRIILEHAHTGLAGDGLIAVSPIDYMIKVRTKERLE
ncbi:MAG: P-II family nitrogen regulator [Thermodesulfovibrionales bacterium]